MILHRRIVRDAVRRIALAASHVEREYEDGLISTEPTFTERLLGTITWAMHGYRARGVRWSALSLHPGPGRSAEEKRFGADFLGVLDIRLSEYSMSKGFMVQAKRAEPGRPFSKAEWGRLTEQCERMLRVTPHSFVFVYSQTNGIRVIPAISVLGSRKLDLLALYSRGVRTFFAHHLTSFIGDRGLHAPTVEAMEALLREHDVAAALHLEAREVDRPLGDYEGG